LPTNGITFTGPTSLNVTGTAKDYDGTITGVQLWVNGLVFGPSTSTSTFTLPWNTNAFGHYLITALATDNDGITNAATPVTAVVRAADTSVTAHVSNLQAVANDYSSLHSIDYPLIREGLFSLQGLAYATIAGNVSRDTNLVSYRVMLLATEEGGTQDYNVTPGVLNAQGFTPGGDNGGSLQQLDFSQVVNGIYDLVLTVRCRGVENSETNVSLRQACGAA